MLAPDVPNIIQNTIALNRVQQSLHFTNTRIIVCMSLDEQIFINNMYFYLCALVTHVLGGVPKIKL